jgi:hypothetical protein
MPFVSGPPDYFGAGSDAGSTLPKPKVSKADWLQDPWLDERTDVSNRSPEEQRRFRAKFRLREPGQVQRY